MAREEERVAVRSTLDHVEKIEEGPCDVRVVPHPLVPAVCYQPWPDYVGLQEEYERKIDGID
jgi:hypothetical protein